MPDGKKYSHEQEYDINKVSKEYGDDAADEIRGFDEKEYALYSGLNKEELTYDNNEDDKELFESYNEYLSMAFDLEQLIKGTMFTGMSQEECMKRLKYYEEDKEYCENEINICRDHMKVTELRRVILDDLRGIELAKTRLKQIEIMKKADEVAERHNRGR